MGLEAECTAEIDGVTVRGKALLETEELLFRGTLRLRIPFREMAPPEVEGEWLRIRFGERMAALHLGEQAEKWAARIRSPRSRLDKLSVKAGQRVAVLGIEDDAFLAELAERVPEFSRGAAAANFDLLFVGMTHREDLAQLAALRHWLKPNGGVWVVRPRGTAALTEAEVRAAAAEAGLVDVKVARFSETHTAEKLVVPVARRTG